ncbi:MAG TPA: enolase C-terminal domain-like protein [Methylomirabilota bacterium]|nr:enolase C-terminal domain-like protein [Methylomirabilota bacterium]
MSGRAPEAPLLRVREVQLRERDVRLRMPFRFGVVTLTQAPQLFVRARITLQYGRDGWGAAAELLAPKWFDKDPALSNEDNFEQLRDAVRVATALYTEGRIARTAFRQFAETHHFQTAACLKRGLNPLVGAFGPALLDRAVLDALCRLRGVSFQEAIRINLPGIAPADFLPEFAGFDMDAFLAGLRPLDHVHARHTVGLVDPITAAAQREGRVGDGLPETLEEVVATYGHTYFKLKVGGDAGADVARLTAIAAVLDRGPAPYFVTLDGNEQYESVDGVLALWEVMERTPALRRLMEATLFVEQPIARKRALLQDVRPLAARRPVIIDESDADLDAFPEARAQGYAGVSSKSCKGLYKSLINRARCAMWNAGGGEPPTYFMSAEDLTTQAGLAVQQDLALVSVLGLTHVERNGHHYVNGMAALPPTEQQAFLAAHPDLYMAAGGTVRLRIEHGRLALGSLACPGFASAAEPDWSSMRESPP